MSSSRLRWMIGFMSLALIGLIAFQLQWINAAITTNDERFQQEVMESMVAVVKKLERREAVQVINRQMLRSSTQSNSSQNQQISQTQESVSIYYQWSDTMTNQQEVNVSVSLDNTGALIYELDTSNINLVVEQDISSQRMANQPMVTESSIPDGQMEHALQKMNNKSQLLVTVLEEMMYGRPLDLRLSAEVLDSLLNEEFRSRGINIPYEFGVWQPNRGLWFAGSETGNQSQIIQSTFAVNLFPNDLYGSNQRLSVIFPTQDQYLKGKIFINMASSGVLLLVILLTFGYSVHTIIRQKKLSEMKTDFINNMTHEFKTPIATIGLAVEAMQDEALSGVADIRNRYIGVIGDENKRLGNQVEKVLQMAIAEREQIKLKLEQTDIHEVIEKALAKISLQLENRQGTISLALDADPSSTLMDPTQMMHVMLNLLDNAIKYSEDEPKIMIRSNVQKRKLVVSVKDHGIGMSREAQKHIFQSFYRVSTGNRHDVKGFGLGLSFVKNIIEEHHGSIDVTSEPGKGTNFTFTLPIRYES